MSLPLRAFLMLRSGRGDWSVSVFRDLDTMLGSWADRENADQTVGVLHVGFDRPASQLFESLAKNFKGKCLLTEAARGSLPRGFECSALPVGEIEGHNIFVATRGWGYSISDISSIPLPSPTAAVVIPEGWISDLAIQLPEINDALQRLGIFNESTYFAKESLLERDARYRAGIFRYRSLVRLNADDPCELVRAAPPWLLDRSFETIDLTVRVSNAFVAADIQMVRDLLPCDVDKLLQIQNFGRKSLRDLHGSLLAALNEGPFDREAKIAEAAESDKLVSEIERSLSMLDERERDILVRRMGFNTPTQTLQEIGDDYKITRERIRQIEAKALEHLLKGAFWSDLVKTKLDGLLLGREFPLPAIGLEAVDCWFDGIGRSISTLKFILANMCEGRFSVIRIDGIDYVGRLNQDDWAKTLREARRILSTGPQEAWAESHCRSLVGSLLNEGRREFRGLLWKHASMLCHFVEQDGQRIFASYGRGADQVVEAVLLDSDVPLHFSEIAKRANLRAGKDFDVRRAHNAAASIGVLFGRGIYGLDHHIRLSDQERVLICDELEQVILGGPDERQWHNSELLSIAAERNLPKIEALDKYTIDIVLRPSQAIQSLGRMTWSKAMSSGSNRIDVRQAVIALLQKAGAPLTSNEIRQRLVAIRGVSDNFQIYSSNSMVRIDTLRWGLNDRDIPLKRADQRAFIDCLVDILGERKQGIHITEVLEEVGDLLKSPEQLSSETIFSLASLDNRLQTTTSQYLFLREWGEARRQTLADATLATLRDAKSSLSLDEVVAGVQKGILRPCEKRAVSSCLKAIDAVFDESTGKWSVPAEDSVVADESEIEHGAKTFLAPITWINQ